MDDERLLCAEVALIPDDPILSVPTEYAVLSRLLQEIIHQAGPVYSTLEYHFDDASWVGFRLAELLPLEANFKQELLEMSSPVKRLEMLQDIVEELVEN